MKSFISTKLLALFLLATLFLFSLFFFQYNIGGEGLFLPRNIIAWLVICFFISFTLFKLSLHQQLVLPKYYAGLFALPIAIFLSSFIAGVEQPINWLFRILFIIGGISFLLSLFQYNFKEKDVRLILTFIVLSVFFNTLISASQIHFPELILDFFPSANQGRPAGMFQQINTNASYSATGILISLYLLSRPSKTFCFNWTTALYILTIGLASYTIMLSASRVGILSVSVGFLVIVIARWPQLYRRKWITSIVILAFIGGGYLGNGKSELLTEKIGTTLDPYSSARMGIYTASVELIKESPLTGYGIGSFKRVFVEKRGNYLSLHPQSGLSKISIINHPHNEFLFWMIEGGVITFIGIITSAIIIVLALISTGWSRGISYSALLLPISLHTQVELPFYLSALHWFLFLILLFIILRHNTITRNLGISRIFSQGLKISAVFISIISSVFLVNSLNVNQDIVSYQKGTTGNVHVLTNALHNIYFNDYAERSIMAMSGVSSIAYNETEKVKVFSEWAESYLLLHPDYVIQEFLVNSYNYLGEAEKACISLNRGLFLYPQNKKLLELNRELKCS
ncbi:MAG: hypothetical protein COA90_04215 [Gammaproteobacteria bacterium]|nr:MAG: hypothetical protein COA90_04215 [Gammaproteobacteria bacterium]